MILRACHRNKRDTAEDHVDAHEQAERPGRSTREYREDEAAEDQVNNAACEHRTPCCGKLSSVIQGEHDRCHAFNQKERNKLRN